MPRRDTVVDWKSLDGAFKKSRRFQIDKDEEGIDHCPISYCEHPGFSSRRGCRKHINVKHPWYKYFDEKPTFIADNAKSVVCCTSTRGNTTLPCCSADNEFSRSLSRWLQSTTGGGKASKQAAISVTRILKFLRYCCEESGEEESYVLSTVQLVDYFLCSSKFLTDFLDYLENKRQMGQSGRLGYVTSISDLLDYRRFNSPPGPVLQNFSVTEVYVKRAKKCLAKQMRSHWTSDLDIETLESRRSWASLSELQSVVPFHIGRYKEILEECQKQTTSISPTDLTFATRFLAVFMFVKVKGCRPMTYQHLTIPMFENAKSNRGMVDQTIFKTAKKYGFNSLYFDETSLTTVDNYIRFVRPLIKPQCEYLLINRNGAQFQKLTELLSVLVFQAIGKYIHPTRYRQIIETESVIALDLAEQKMVSEDQKHSSNVARVYYQKLRSRDVAIQGRACMDKLRGAEGKAMDSCVKKLNGDASTKENSGEKRSAEYLSKELICARKTKSLQRKEPVKFTKQEDAYIKRGIQKFGQRWSSILRHSAYHFQDSREARTLRMRAIALKLIN